MDFNNNITRKQEEKMKKFFEERKKKDGIHFTQGACFLCGSKS